MNRRDREQWLSAFDGPGETVDLPLWGYHRVPAGWSVVRPAGVPEHLLYFVVSGAAQGQAAGRPIRIEPGCVLWIGPGVPFELRLADAQRPITLYRFRLTPPARPATGASPSIGAILLHEAWDLRATFDALINELSISLPLRDRRVRALLVILFTALFRLMQRGDGAGRVLSAAQRRQLEAYADDHVAQRPTPDDLAAVVGLSPDYFARRFRRTFGMPPRTWLVRRRIQHAALRLDESSDSISQVADMLGYPDVFLFSRQFKAVMGIPPRAYRSRA